MNQYDKIELTYNERVALAQKNKADFREEINKYFIELEMRYDYHLSESQIAKELGINKKTFIRYCNGETYPEDESKVQAIRDYFRNLLDRLEHEKRIERMAEGYKFSSSTDEDIEKDESDDRYLHPTDYMSTQEIAGVTANGLSRYTPFTQQFIIDNFEMIWHIEAYEIEFIRQLRRLSKNNPAALNKVVNMLESIPVTMEMTSFDGYSEYRGGGIFKPTRSVLLGFGSHRVEYVIAHKNQTYEKFLKAKKFAPIIYKNADDELAENVNNKATFNSLCEEHALSKFGHDCDNEDRFFEEEVSVYRDDVYLDDECTVKAPSGSIIIHDNAKDSESDYSKKRIKYFGERITEMHKDYYEHLDLILQFTRNDWYYLYLLTRLQIADITDYSDTRVHEVNDEYFVKKNEYMLWQYLSLVQ